MKRFTITIALVLCAAAMLSAQGLYLDLGGGLGNSSTDYKFEVDRVNFTYSESGMGFDLGGKVGYGPTPNLPLFFIGEVSYTQGKTYEETHSNEYQKSKLEFEVEHLFFGPGIIYYPAEYFQLAGSIGLVNSTVKLRHTDEYYFIHDGTVYYEKNSEKESASGLGFGFNLSAGYEVGGKNGLLIGAKMSYLSSEVEFKTLSDNKLKIDASTLFYGIFFKYRLRG